MKGPIHLRDINRAREYYNPLRGLDIPRAVRLLEEGERGRYDELQKLNRMLEKRHPTLRALKSRRLGALKKLDWDCKVRSDLPAGMTAAKAERQRDFLRDRYERIQNLPEAFEFLALPSLRGFSHLEKRHEDDRPSLPVVRLQPVPQWHWLRDSQTWAWRYDATAMGSEASSVLIDPANFIIREVDDPLCEIALICFVRRSLAGKDWTAFMDDYAIPSIFAMLGENTPLDKVAEWLDLVKKVTNNSRGALPPGSKIESLELSKLDGTQFEKFIAHQDKELVLAGTGGLLTMLTADTGMNGDAQSHAHEATFEAIALAEAQEISSLLQTQFDAPLLAEEFPSEPAVAYFELAALDQEDVTALADRVVKFYGAGLAADPEEISEKSGLTLTRRAGAGAPEIEPELRNRAPAAVEAATDARFLSAAERRLSAADLATMAPLVDLVRPIRAEAARLAALDDDAALAAGLAALQPRLRALEAALPDLEDQILRANPALDDAFTDILGTAMAAGMIEHAESARPIMNREARETAAKASNRHSGGPDRHRPRKTRQSRA